MNILDLVQADVPLRKVSNRDGGEYSGPCPLCGGKDRFIVWPHSSRSVKFWCRESGSGCGFKGDIISYLRQVRGLTFKEACRQIGKRLAPLYLAAPKTKHELRIERIDRELEADYLAWEKLHYLCWTDRRRELHALQEIAEIGYRQTVRCPELYTDAQADYWARSLSEVYAALYEFPEQSSRLLTLCDLFTMDERLEERFTWWDSGATLDNVVK